MVKKKLFNLANSLTILRLFAGPLCFYLIWIDERNLALFVFILAVLSDKADGIIARKRGITAFGEFLDPIADNSLIVLTAIALIIKNVIDFYFLKYGFFIFLIFVLATVINSMKLRKLDVPPIMVGKINVALFYILIIYIFLGLPVSRLLINIVLVYTFIVSLKYLVYSIKVKKTS
ncbi:CDP-alcohol phosphatidyltransferase family protein [Candidatus Woesearchaeota archaeon]|nr:CDP-alcohol phosphatidyltransferase family protein [Candidatus Woesearchaeota archaeon]